MSDNKRKVLEVGMVFVLIIFAMLYYIIGNIISKNGSNASKNIAIFVNGKKIDKIDGQKIDINVDGTYTIKSENGDYNVIKIKDRKISCIEANCPDEICVRHGTLRSDIDNDMIICAPHQMVIQYQ